MKRSRSGSSGRSGLTFSTCQYAAVKTSAQDSDEARCAACAACDISIILPRNCAARSFNAPASAWVAALRTATFIVLSQSRAPKRSAWPSGLVVIFRRQFCQITAEPFRPANDVVDACFKRQRVSPAEFGAQLDAVERVGGILAGSFRADLDAIIERFAEAFENHFDQGADRDQFVARDV